MRSFPSLLLALACTLFAVACWTQFDPPPEPDDDDTTVDDDDTTVDDDDTTVDDDDTGPTGCTEAATISCSEDFQANNNGPGSTNSVELYECIGLPFTGPEYAVRWDATTSGPTNVTISGLTAGQDLDLFVLDDPAGTGCDPDSCAASSNGTGQEESATFDAVAGQTYYFVVDGYEGSISNFVMSLDCDAGGDDDDDDTTTDDDDTIITDDDDTAPSCTDPALIGATVTLLDPLGSPTTTLSTSDPMTVAVSVVNSAGNNGTTAFQYGSSCIFNWGLYYQNGDSVHGGPTCAGASIIRNYLCDEDPVFGSDVISPIEAVSGDLVPAGTSLNLVVNTIHFGTFNYVVTVP